MCYRIVLYRSLNTPCFPTLCTRHAFQLFFLTRVSEVNITVYRLFPQYTFAMEFVFLFLQRRKFNRVLTSTILFPKNYEGQNIGKEKRAKRSQINLGQRGVRVTPQPRFFLTSISTDCWPTNSWIYEFYRIIIRHLHLLDSTYKTGTGIKLVGLHCA